VTGDGGTGDGEVHVYIQNKIIKGRIGMKAMDGCGEKLTSELNRTNIAGVEG
jgi:hypothetical protein